MPLALTFLGTSASRPTVERGVSAIALVREGETFLVDCGEGTQRQMMRWGVSFNLGDLLLTHLHTDHVLGVLGLLRTMALQGRTEPMRLFGPRGTQALLRRADGWGVEKLTFPLTVQDIAPGEPLRRAGYDLLPFPVDHRGASAVGWALVEHTRLGRFDPERARALGIPEGPLWGRIHKGEAVTLPDGRVVPPAELVGPSRPGRRVVVTGDTRPCAATVEVAVGADLLVHESTFGDEEAPRALETGHSTAREAGEVARLAGVRRLALTHFSARYSRDASVLRSEASATYRGDIVLAKDGLTLEVPFADEPAPVPAEAVRVSSE